METRLTLRPGQSGTKKLLARYGERLVRVRYLYDDATGRRLKTVELIVESIPWHRRPAPRAAATTKSSPCASPFTDLRARQAPRRHLAPRTEALGTDLARCQTLRHRRPCLDHLASYQTIHTPRPYAGIYRHLPLEICIQ
jgi:hypothetical protein